MIIEYDSIIERSNPETVTANSSTEFDLSFLDAAAHRMSAPCVRQLMIHITGTVSGVTGTALPEDAWKIAQSVTVSDRGGALFDQVPGSLLRLEAQRYHGTAQFQESAAVASGATNTAYNVFIPLDFEIPAPYAHRPADTRLPLLHLTKGGRVNVRWQTPAGFALGALQAFLYADIIDERTPELKTRRVVRVAAIDKTEDNYPVLGSLQRAVISSDLVTAGYTSLSAETTLDSRDLQYPSALSVPVLRHRYRELLDDPATDDEVLAANAIELYGPTHGQHIGRMPDLQSLHVKGLASTAGSRRLLLSYFENRPGGLAAEWMGFDSVALLEKAILDRGTIPVKGGGTRSVNTWPATLSRRLPIRL